MDLHPPKPRRRLSRDPAHRYHQLMQWYRRANARCLRNLVTYGIAVAVVPRELLEMVA